MAWVYVPGLADSSLPCNSSSVTPTTPLLTWRGKPLSSRIWSREWTRGSFVRRLSGTTLTTSMADRGVAAFIASLQVSPANRLVSRVIDAAWKMNAGYGPQSLESFATFDHELSSWKTSRPSLFTDLLTSAERWPKSAITLRGVCFHAPRSEAPTVESDGSDSEFWRTPDSPNDGGVRTHTSSQGRGHQVTIAEQATNWATPKTANGHGGADATRDDRGAGGPDLINQVLNWSTPTTHDVRSGKGTQVRVGSPALNEQVDKWPTPTTTDAASAGRHTTTTGVMNPGTSLTDAIRLRERWNTPTIAPDAPNANSNKKQGAASLGDQSRYSHLDPGTLLGGSECLPSDPTSPQQWQTPGTDSFRSRSGDRKEEQGLDQQARSEAWRTPHTRDHHAAGPREEAEQRQTSLSDQIQPMWKTPHGMANTDVNGKTGGAGGEHNKQVMGWKPNGDGLWGTPTSTTGGDGERPTGVRTLLCNQVKSEPKAQLNPRFDEWLMGWPPGWTDFAPVATEWCHWKRRMRSALSRLVSAGSSAPTLRL